MATSSTNVLAGYRIGFMYENHYNEQYYTNNGASILNISRAPEESEDEFKEWWRQEVDKARRDGVVIVVMKLWNRSNRIKWLDKTEEEEWYKSSASDDDGTGRVRYTTRNKINEAVNKGELLMDDWGDYIEKGDVARRNSESDDSSVSEAEFEVFRPYSAEKVYGETADLHSMSTSAKILDGYRIGFVQENCYGYKEYFEKNGASILHINRRAPSESEEEFKEWWRQEVDKARRDRVTIVVVKTRSESSHKRWLNNIEEEEWYKSSASDDDGTGRVRYTSAYKIDEAVNKGELLMDDWGESIEKGDVTSKGNGSNEL